MANLPVVVLIGDSIRMGYQAVVTRELEGIAEVWGPEQNGGNSANILGHLDEWILSKEAAVVHVNCGLHDLRKEFDTGKPAIDLEAYEANVREILERLKKEFAGKVVWVTTTPVNEEWHHANKGFDRFEADVDGYNKIASGIARELGIPIDDLFSAITAGGKDQLLRDDGVHFTEAGSELLGKAVADCIRSMLA
ncbi:MAG: SGNH/GDSL hydrolase family protein [Gemmatimonadetes bacterium]|nr:SGNH/GDSL hydrolase family protein [Gemmatimonadota bacterium]